MTFTSLYRGPGLKAISCPDFEVMLNKTLLLSVLTWEALISKEPIKKGPAPQQGPMSYLEIIFVKIKCLFGNSYNKVIKNFLTLTNN